MASSVNCVERRTAHYGPRGGVRGTTVIRHHVWSSMGRRWDRDEKRWHDNLFCVYCRTRDEVKHG